MTIEEIFSDFELLDDWEDRYRYVIELGKDLDQLPENARNDTNKVQGCASQVWLATSIEDNDEPQDPHISYVGDSDAHIVRGLIAILLAIYSGKKASEILGTDAQAIFLKLGLGEHLTPQRSNGFASMVERIRADAAAAINSAPSVH
jgi:cysteine desulfuration protein SufE